MAEKLGEFAELRDIVRSFVAERDWAQFHTPKNLAIALSVEASELLEPFQWLQAGAREELGEKQLIAVKHELADVLHCLLQLADKLDIDLVAAFHEKMQLNAAKYPAEKVRGDSRKYTEY